MDEELDEIVSVPFDEDDIDEASQVYRTYKMDFERKRALCHSLCHGREPET